MKDAVYQISGLSLKNCDRELPDIHTYIRTYIHTRIKATRCETLRTDTTNNSKFEKTKISFFPHFEPILFTRIKATRCETLRTVTTNNSKKHSHLTYCLNVSLMVQKRTATNFSTSEPILFILIVHENNLFWYVTTNI